MKYPIIILFLVITSSVLLFNQELSCQPKNHKTFFIRVGENIQLEVLDWGGQGDPIMFLCGVGGNAHIYDEFAPLFTSQYRVYGLTRRGAGASSRPSTGYDPITLTKDLLIVIDSLHIERITLIGHSFAGQELTRFASMYPDRINKLVYLDAVRNFNDSVIQSLRWPQAPPMKAHDSLSIQNLQFYFQHVDGFTTPIDYLRSAYEYDESGKMIRYLSDSAESSMWNNVEYPAYSNIQAPALSIRYSPDSIVNLFSYYPLLDSIQQRIARESYQPVVQWLEKEQQRFLREIKNSKVVFIPNAQHFLFYSQPRRVFDEIIQFLNDN